jgi:hypothetical protein
MIDSESGKATRKNINRPSRDELTGKPSTDRSKFVQETVESNSAPGTPDTVYRVKATRQAGLWTVQGESGLGSTVQNI